MSANDILAMTVDELKTELGKLDLLKTGNKTELQERLLDHFGLRNRKESDLNNGAASITVDRMGVERSNIFSLRDIQDSVSAFSGDGLPEVNYWLQEFDDVACTVGWDDLRKYVYAKQLLKGAARIFIRSQSDVNNWPSLKKVLMREFGTKLSSVEVHKILSNRLKKNDETFREYLYSLQEISKPINIDDESIIEYFVQGIKDSAINKSILYQARTIEELKEKLKTYEKIRLAGQPSSSKVVESQGKRDIDNNSGRRCFKCGNKGHLANECKKGEVKCFKCKGFGHKSFDCTKNANADKKDDKTKKNENNMHTLVDDIASSSRRIFTDIAIFGKNISAIVDTGSDISVLRYDTLMILSDIELKSDFKILTGIGGKTIKTLGSFKARTKLGAVEIDINFHVAKESDILYSAVIGNDVLVQVDLIIDANGVRFRNKISERSLVKKEESVIVDSSKHDNQPTMETNPIAELDEEFGEMIHSATIGDFAEDELQIDHLEKCRQNKIRSIVKAYRPIKPETFPIRMKIVLSDDTPVVHRPRRVANSDQVFIDNQVKEWLKDGIIVPSYSEYSAPVVLVRKKDGTKRLCCDYRKLNEKIIRDNFPMVLIDDIVQRLKGAKVFTTLDLRNGFFHVPIEENSQKYTSFVTSKGQYEFKFVPFGISNSPAIFCRYIASVFRELISDGTLIAYMDDIVIPSEDEEEGAEKLLKFLKVSEQNGLNIKWAKCQFLQRKINFLGYIFENSTILPSTEKTRAVVNYPLPTNIKALQRFLGLTSYLRRFIPGYASMARPLSNLLRKDTKFKMGDEEILAFEQLKNSMVNPPVLKIFDPKSITEIHTDASLYGYGAVLLQKDEDLEFHPVEYMSRKTTQTEQKYHSYELEVLAVIEALKKWRIFVLGIPIKIVTDCNAFALTMRKQDVPPRVSRWALFLQEFNYKIEHRPGMRMKHVDALSRLTCMMIEDSLRHRLKQAQLQDGWIKAIRKILEAGPYEDYFMKYDLLHKDPDNELLVVPSSMEQEIIQIAHRQGHFATRKTQELLQKTYYIPNLTNKVDSVVKSCVECLVSEAKRGRKEGFLSPIDKADRPVVTYHIDHVGPMESTRKQYNYILVVVDAFSKFVWLYPTKSTGTNEVIDRLVKQAVIFGNPRRIITDRGTAFTSNQFKEYCAVHDIQHLLIATGVPRGNGQVERLNNTVVTMLAKLCQEKPENWYRHVGLVQQVLNSTPPRSTKIAPFKLITGLDMRRNDSIEMKELLENLTIEELNRDRDAIREEAKENILAIQQENRREYNRKRVPETVYDVNQLVAIKRTQFGTGMKLRPKYLGPYKIVKKLNHGRYEVQKVGSFEGPNVTTTVSEYMKPWEGHSRANVSSGWPIVGMGD